MKKTLRWTILLSLLLVCVMIPVMAQKAEAADYNIWVGTERVTDDHLSGDGWSFDPDSKTLTLKDAKIDTHAEPNDDDGDTVGNGLIYAKRLDFALTITGTADLSKKNAAMGGIFTEFVDTVVLDNAVIQATGDQAGIQISDGELIIKGDKTSITATGLYGSGIKSTNLTIEGGTVDATAGSGAGIDPEKSFVISGGTVTATGDNSAFDIVPELKGTFEVTVNENEKWDGTTSLDSDTFKTVQIVAVPTYTVTWKNADGKVLETDEGVVSGATPEYNGKTPEKAADAQYTYTFAGWDPAITTVTGDATYTATYTETVNKYTIKFVNWDGKELQSSPVAYGDTPSYTGAEPTKAPSTEYTYTFADWTPKITAVTGDKTYTADFDIARRTYTITWKNDDGSVIGTTEVEYGKTPMYPDQKKEADDQYTYTFAGWDPIPAAVAADATYTATYNATPINTYPLWVGGKQVTEKNLDDILGDNTGSAKYDPKTNTLTLNNPMISGVYENAQIYSDGINLTINGDVKLTLDSAQYSIIAKDGDLTISGGTITADNDIVVYGDFNITDGDITVTDIHNAIVCHNTITVSGGKLTATGTGENSKGIHTAILNITKGDVKTTGVKAGVDTLSVYGRLDMSGGTLYAEATDKEGYGINFGFGGTIRIVQGDVTAKGGKYGIYTKLYGSSGGTVYISGGNVTAEGKEYGIYASDNITISGGTVTATAEGEESHAIYAEKGAITITDATVNATATGDKGNAIYTAEGNIKIEGCEVVAEGKAAGIYAEKGDITISGGEVTATATGDFDRAICAEEGDITISCGTVAAEGDYYGIIARKNITISGDKTVVTVAMTGEDGFAALCAYTGDITISGSEVNATAKGEVGIYADKSITISGGNVTAEGKEYGIYSYADNITISGGTVTAEGKERGIIASKQLTISGGTVNATATGNEGYAIRAWGGDITISGGEMNATATGKNGNAICAEEGNITISGDATVNATATGEKGKAIYAEKGDITISGGEVNATAEGELAEAIHAKEGTIKITSATVNATSEDDCAIYAGDITIDGATVTVGNFYGIIAESLDSNKGNLWISDSTIKANTKGYCIYSGGGELIISDSNVEAMATYGPGISGNSLITISGSTITAAGDTHGIEGECSKITISNSTVDLKGDRYGIYAPKAEITIEGKDTEVKAEGGKLAAILASADTIIVNEPLAILDPQGGVIGETTDDGKQYQTIFASDGETVAKKVYIAEGGTTGGILVVDPDTGEPVVGGTVSLIDPETGEVLDSWTPDGTPHPLPGSLPPGEYTIVVELPDGTVIETTIIVGEDGSVSIVGPDGELIPVAPDEVITVGGSGKKYTVTWVIDGKEETEKYAAGEMPSHKTPKKASDVLYDYTFKGWTPAIEKVTKDATYTAEFEASVSPYSPFSPFSPFSPTSPFGPHGAISGSGTTPDSGTPDSATPGSVTLPFTDVSPNSPYYDDIQYVYENDIMNGMSETEFGENLPLTRGMIVTILHRVEGRPEVAYTGAFTDVADGMWYTDGVEWAASHGIVLGYGDGRYGPDDNVTREQLAAILFRYAKFKGYDVSVGEDTNILSYYDAFTWGDWAV
ncbi:MAG: carbohydrate-binding domain-containing protein, partial [Clostridia bacterium]|nr:carbohydrate-binding domain-containing protein [Clostridia bacterium]